MKDNINIQLKKYKINRVFILSAISDPDICLKNKKYSNLLNVKKTIKLIDILINKKYILYIFFFQNIFLMVRQAITQKKVKTVPIIFTESKKLIVENYIKKKLKTFQL